MTDNPNRARDHLANEETLLAWLRTGVATIVFGFAVRRFSIALQEILQFEGKAAPTPVLTAWLGIIAIVAGVPAILAGHMRYHQTQAQITRGTFENLRASPSTSTRCSWVPSGWRLRNIWRGSRFADSNPWCKYDLYQGMPAGIP